MIAAMKLATKASARKSSDGAVDATKTILLVLGPNTLLLSAEFLCADCCHSLKIGINSASCDCGRLSQQTTIISPSLTQDLKAAAR
jgi:hypothetical protein